MDREGKFAQQQQVATKLQRLSAPEEPYIWWIICSLILQARSAVRGSVALGSCCIPNSIPLIQYMGVLMIAVSAETDW